MSSSAHSSKPQVDDEDGDAPGDDEDERGQQGPDGHNEAGEDEEPSTRAAFLLLKESYSSTDLMVEDFLKDHVHHLRMRVLLLCGETLHAEYTKALETHKSGYTAMLRWQALRSYGVWFQTPLSLLEIFECGGSLEYLAMRYQHGDNSAVPLDDPSVQTELKIAKVLYDFITQLASARCWSQLHHTLCFPHCFAQVFLPVQSQLADAGEFFRTMSLSLHQLDKERRRHQGRGPRARLLQELVDDLGTLDWVLTREIIIEGTKAQWDLTSDSLRELAFSIFAGSAETKNLCENPFAWLSDSCARQSKLNKVGDATKLMYLLTSPYAGQGGSTPLVPTQADIRTQSPADNKEFLDLEPFSGTFRRLPIGGITKQDIKKWRPAGYHAQRKAAAAAAFMLQYVHPQNGVDFNALESVWAGISLFLAVCVAAVVLLWLFGSSQ